MDVSNEIKLVDVGGIGGQKHIDDLGLGYACIMAKSVLDYYTV